MSATPELLAPLVRRMRRDVSWRVPAGGHPDRTDRKIDRAVLERHLDGGPRCGAAFIKPGESVTSVGLLDLDSHKGDVPWDRMVEVCAQLCDELSRRRLAPIVFRSTGGAGIHIYAVWDEPQDAYSVRECLRQALQQVGLKSGTRGVAGGEVEVFPKQDRVPAGGFGNMAVLPLAGASAWLDPLFDYLPMPPDTAFEWPASAPVPVLERPERETVVPEPSVGLASFRAALDAIPNAGEHELDYDEWRNVMFSIHFATGGSDEGLALAHEFSGRSSKYDPEFLDNRVWPYIQHERENPITDRYVVHLASGHGWVDASLDDFEAIEAPPDDFEAVEPPPDDKPKLRFQVKSTTEFTSAPPPRWLVKGVLPEAELVVMYGASGSGKSFLALDLAAALDQGVPWRGEIKTRQARVVYIAAEGAGGFRSRIRAWEHEHQARLGLGIIDAAPNFLEKEDVLEVAKAVIAWGRADLIVVDTWAQVLPGANENSGEDIGRALAYCKGLRRATGATIMLVHHSGKDESRGARGWSGLRAAADAELEVVRDGERRAMQITKQKDGEDGAGFGFELVQCPTGVLDEDGEVVQSCIVRHNNLSPSEVRASAKTPGLGVNERLLLRALHDNLVDVGGGLRAEALLDEGVQLLDPPVSGRDRRREKMRKALEALLAAGHLRAEGAFVFPIDEERA